MNKSVIVRAVIIKQAQNFDKEIYAKAKSFSIKKLVIYCFYTTKNSN